MKAILQKLLSATLACAAFYCALAMFTQAMLGGETPEEITRDRIYVWAFFLIAGWFAMTAVHLWNRSAIDSSRTSARRLFLFPLGHLSLTAGLYFFDYHQTTSLSPQHLGFAIVLAVAGIAMFLAAIKKQKPQ